MVVDSLTPRTTAKWLDWLGHVAARLEQLDGMGPSEDASELRALIVHLNALTTREQALVTALHQIEVKLLKAYDGKSQGHVYWALTYARAALSGEAWG